MWHKHFVHSNPSTLVLLVEPPCRVWILVVFQDLGNLLFIGPIVRPETGWSLCLRAPSSKWIYQVSGISVLKINDHRRIRLEFLYKSGVWCRHILIWVVLSQQRASLGYLWLQRFECRVIRRSNQKAPAGIWRVGGSFTRGYICWATTDIWLNLWHEHLVSRSLFIRLHNVGITLHSDVGLFNNY